MKYCLTVFFSFLFASIFANDSVVITQLLKRIYHLQPKQEGIFPKGCFPSYRMYALNKTRYKADINPFFTALISFTLQDIKADLSPTQQLQANNIITNTLSVFPKFQNRRVGRSTYNFWTTDKPQVFPYSGWLNLFNKSRALPDDLDDTVMILMAQQKNDTLANEIHQLMQGYINKKYQKASNTFPEYRELDAYSTWFGQKMAVEFDLNVMANVLYFVQFYNLKWTSADSESLHFIEDVIKTGRHITAADYISPQYARLPLILYHVSRLMALKPIPSLEKLKPQLIEDTKKALSTTTNFMDQVILSTSLMRWGVNVPEIKINNKIHLIDLIEDESFCFFIANIGSVMSDQKKKFMTRTKLGTFYYYCPAYNSLLLLENLVWHKRRKLVK